MFVYACFLVRLEGRKCRNLLAINHTALLYEKKSLLNV